MAQVNQLIVPQLQFSILSNEIDLSSGYIQGKLCKDSTTWKNGKKRCKDYATTTADCKESGDNGITAYDACKVSCNTCPGEILLKRSEKMNLRLPSPMEDIIQPDYSSIQSWNVNDENTINNSNNLELDEIKEKLDELIQNIPDPRCSCRDIKKNLFKPYRCHGADISEQLIWDGEYNHIPIEITGNSSDTDKRYKIKCNNGQDYKNTTINPKLKGKDIVYNCTKKHWELKDNSSTNKDSRNNPFTKYDIEEMIHCDPVKPESTPESSPDKKDNINKKDNTDNKDNINKKDNTDKKDNINKKDNTDNKDNTENKSNKIEPFENMDNRMNTIFIIIILLSLLILSF